MTEKNHTFPSALEAVVLAVALMMVEYLVGACLLDLHALSMINPLDTGGIVLVLSNAVIFTFVMDYKGLSYRELFHSAASQAGVALPLILPAILLTVPALIMVISAIVQVIIELFPLSAAQVSMFREMGSGSVGSIVIGCLLAPVLEEMFFRGIILRSFLQQYPRWASIAGSALIFGAVHMNLYQFAAATILGLFLGWLYQRSRSLLPCIALHAAYNTVLVVMNLAGEDWIAAHTGGSLPLLVVATVILGVVGLSWLRRLMPAAA